SYWASIVSPGSGAAAAPGVWASAEPWGACTFAAWTWLWVSVPRDLGANEDCVVPWSGLIAGATVVAPATAPAAAAPAPAAAGPRPRRRGAPSPRLRRPARVPGRRAGTHNPATSCPCGWRAAGCCCGAARSDPSDLSPDPRAAAGEFPDWP